MNWCVSTRPPLPDAARRCHRARRGGGSAARATRVRQEHAVRALVHRGWRLLSDEVALVSLQDGRISPAARPISLKNASIEIIRAFAPDAVFTPTTHGTTKGSVTHIRAPREHVARMLEPAQPRWVVVPRYMAKALAFAPRWPGSDPDDPGHQCFQPPCSAGSALALGRLVEGCECFEFSYSQLDDAIAVFDAYRHWPGGRSPVADLLTRSGPGPSSGLIGKAGPGKPPWARRAAAAASRRAWL